MRCVRFLCTGLLAAAAAPSLAAAQTEAPPSGFTALFNGQDLSGWRGRPHLSPYEEAAWSAEQRAEKQREWKADAAAHWSVDDGEIVNDGHGVFLTTVREFGDVELLLDYKTVAGADSGIYLRASPQVQIWDTTEAGGKWGIGAGKGSGGLFNNQRHPKDPLVLADRPFGEWNRFRIRMVGERTSVWLNGQLVVDDVPLENYWDRARPLPARGPVQLQTHGGEIRFRNLFAREIPASEATRHLADRNAAGFEPVFNGRDLSGWAGAVHSYEVRDGTIVCRPGQGGTLYTAEEFGDFVARLEFKVPPGGNNGLAIRYPGEGDTAYVGMCELQVLDDSAEKYAALEPWQYHGSVYGLVPARRGYQRPAGSWNFQEVRVEGSRVRVELNGTVIVDADLASIEKPASGRNHPGRSRVRGHFGFAGHGDPVQFRSVRIKRLD